MDQPGSVDRTDPHPGLLDGRQPEWRDTDQHLHEEREKNARSTEAIVSRGADQAATHYRSSEMGSLLTMPPLASTSLGWLASGNETVNGALDRPHELPTMEWRRTG